MFCFSHSFVVVLVCVLGRGFFRLQHTRGNNQQDVPKMQETQGPSWSERIILRGDGDAADLGHASGDNCSGDGFEGLLGFRIEPLEVCWG